MTSPGPGPARRQRDLADMVEMLLDKGVVVNADIVVSIGDTKLLGVQIRAALASFETAAEYGLEFPEGTDMERVEAAARGRTRGRSERSEEETDRDGSSDDETVDEREASTSDDPDRVEVSPNAGPNDEEANDADD